MSSGLFRKTAPTGKWWQDHSLSIVIAIILLVQTSAALYLGHRTWLNEEASHGQQIEGWPADFWIFFVAEYTLSVVADTYGVLLIVLLSKWLTERGSSEGQSS